LPAAEAISALTISVMVAFTTAAMFGELLDGETGGNKPTESIQSEPAAGGRLLPKGKARDSRDTMNLLRKFILASFWGASYF
jgi:hypothetical protein